MDKNLERLKRWSDADPERAKASSRARTARYRAKNIEKVNARTRAWYEKNRDYVAAYNKERIEIARPQRLKRYKEKAEQLRNSLYQSRANNPERFQASMHRYRVSDRGRETRQLCEARRRTKKREGVCTLTKAEWRDILERYNQSCVYCNRSDLKLTQDHVIPISKGGHHTKENVVPACRSCNSRKSARLDYPPFTAPPVPPWIVPR